MTDFWLKCQFRPGFQVSFLTSARPKSVNGVTNIKKLYSTERKPQCVTKARNMLQNGSPIAHTTALALVLQLGMTEGSSDRDKKQANAAVQ